jgi:hypothetical protein
MKIDEGNALKATQAEMVDVAVSIPMAGEVN